MHHIPLNNNTTINTNQIYPKQTNNNHTSCIVATCEHVGSDFAWSSFEKTP